MEGGDVFVRLDSIVYLVIIYLKWYRIMIEEMFMESEGFYFFRCVRFRMSNCVGKYDRVFSRKWCESIVN